MNIDTPILIALILIFLSGIFDGTAETLKWHPKAFFRVLKKTKASFWNPEVSFTNKYKNNDPSKGEKFFLSKTVLVFLTDGYHFMRWLRNLLTFLALTVILTVATFSSPVLWYMFPALFLLSYSFYTVGFAVAYDFLFR